MRCSVVKCCALARRATFSDSILPAPGQRANNMHSSASTHTMLRGLRPTHIAASFQLPYAGLPPPAFCSSADSSPYTFADILVAFAHAEPLNWRACAVFWPYAIRVRFDSAFSNRTATS